MVAGARELRGQRRGKMKSLRRAAQFECKRENVNMRPTGKEMLRRRKTEDRNEYGDSIEE